MSNNDKYGFAFEKERRGRQFSKWIGEKKTVLDVGCRDGTLSRWYWDNNCVDGMDIDDKALRIFAQNNPNLPAAFHQDIDLPWNIPSLSYDIVVMGEILEHTINPIHALWQAFRVLKQDGLLIGSVPNAYRVKNYFVPDNDPDHKHRFSGKELKNLLSRYFKILEMKYTYSQFSWINEKLFGNTIIFLCEKEAYHGTVTRRENLCN